MCTSFYSVAQVFTFYCALLSVLVLSYSLSKIRWLWVNWHYIYFITLPISLCFEGSFWLVAMMVWGGKYYCLVWFFITSKFLCYFPFVSLLDLVNINLPFFWTSFYIISFRVWKGAGWCTHILEGHSGAISSVSIINSEGLG